MDLHHSENQNLYLRQSYLTSNPLNRSILHSRIEYQQSQSSLSKYLWSFIAIMTALFLCFFLFRHLVKERDVVKCRGESNLSFLVHFMEAKLFGKVDPQRCKSKTEETTEENERQKVRTIKETKTCPFEKDSQNQNVWSSILPSFSFGNPPCEKLKQHDEKIKKLRQSVRPFSQVVPNLEDIKAFPHKYHRFRKQAEDKAVQNIRPEIEGNFADIERGIANGVPPIERDITDLDFISKFDNLDSLLNSKLIAADLGNSTRLFSQKEYAIKNLKESFDSLVANKNCNDAQAELKKALSIQDEKRNYSLSRLRDLNNNLEGLEGQTTALLQQKSGETAQPLKDLLKIEQEIDGLRRKKSELSGGSTHSSPESEIKSLNQRIEDLKRKIDSNETKKKSNDSELVKYQDEQKALEEELKQLKVEVGSLSLKLQINSQHSQIKQFLLSLVKNDKESEQLIQKMKTNTEVSKTEMFKIVKAFMAQSQGYEVESNFSDKEILEFIEKDQKEFEEIMKVYQDLKDMIQKFKDMEFDLQALQKKVNDKQLRKEEIKRKLASISQTLRRLFDLKNDLENDSNLCRDEIERLRVQIELLNSKASTDKAFLSHVDQDISAKITAKNDLESKHKVQSKGHCIEIQSANRAS
jgi:chromosome segregation ATPase